MIEVTCAVICLNGRILSVKRAMGKPRPGKWEFPGGKIKKGETEIDSLKREILEELGVEIVIGARLNPVEHSYPDIRIRLIPFLATVTNPAVRLVDHSELVWLPFEMLYELDWSEADLGVLDQLNAAKVFENNKPGRTNLRRA
ncbi:(deoxy)nucleoside triphosphate pyrophosphohydrolase [Lunatimonas salinarum]|uniref:(deoxy)nucleoside triphosphate pyrophosphohydrolase n=1 Tax=Lunatimonas salinarum TaxID=1774590 RepID=UPI001ADFFB35|nr:(deoxy)nucleoside triphosphate pyrophosphohydrolase [Lunatimonas salinarum]